MTASRLLSRGRPCLRRMAHTFPRRHVDLSRTACLDAGGFDLPTVPPDAGRCGIADVRSEHHLATEFGILLPSVAPVDFLIEPTLAEIARCSSRPRRCVAIDPETNVYCPWEREHRFDPI